MNNLEVYLLGYVVVREVMHFAQVNDLLNKLMSRNYHDYVVSKNVAKTMGTQESMAKEETDLPEDLAALHGFGMN